MTDLSQLLEKVRTAEAGSAELDLDIHKAIFPEEFKTYERNGRSWIGWRSYVHPDHPDLGEILYGPASEYSTSLDAIVALIERELPVNTTRTTTDPSGCSAQITWWPDGLSAGKRVQSDEASASLPLAMVAALLDVISKEKADG